VGFVHVAAGGPPAVGGLHMARWKALPGGTDPAVVRFVVELRRMKDGSGLSLNQLAVRTGYSASSWERYLGGRVLPPREAAEALAGVVGADTVRLMVLYEAAVDAWQSGRPDDESSTGTGQPDGAEEPTGTGLPDGAEEPDGAAEPDGGVRPEEDGEEGRPGGELPTQPAGAAGPRHRLRIVLTGVVAAVAGAAVVLLTVQPWQSGPVCAPVPRAAATAPPVKYVCTYTRRDGRWYAGNSTTLTDVVEVEMYGAEVAEVQCLLQRAGISPGGIDGGFGPLTEQGLIKEQQAHHLGVDGVVGPQTWAALRG
jgi:peptidoglycan hydrolase-like protein with peptidoglycan-binding domain